MKRQITKRLLLVGSCLCCLWLTGRAAHATSAAATSAQLEAIKNWQAKRFGMFIHWGPISLKGTEIGWSRIPGPNGEPGGTVPAEEYDALYRQFNPTNFNANDWVSIAQAAGAKYLVFTTKHHDGFCEFDSKLTDYKITNPESPFHRDVVKELAAACQHAGLAFGVYYSQPDEHHPDYRKPTHEKYVQYMHGQVRELLSNYGPISVIWFDGLGGSANDWDAERLFPTIRQLQPNILINNRCGLAGDFDTPEQRIGSYQDERPWETCMTLCEQWAWKPDDRMKSLEQCIATLVRCAGGDGNLLFNVGPMPDGRIEPRQVKRMKEIGQWLKRNGESIYGTRGGPWKPNRALASTRTERTIYLHVFHSSSNAIELPDIPRKVVDAALLNGDKVEFTQQDGKLRLRIPQRQPIDTIVKLQPEGTAMDLPALEIPLNFVAEASNIYQNQTNDYGPQFAFDGDPQTRWATDEGTKQAWIAVTLNSPRTVRRVKISEAYNRVRKFELQRRDEGNWKTILEGTTLGSNFQQEFAPVTGREFRLRVLDATEGPTINEMELQ
ncbi:MAG TPA: alpha-L-fucosidase [Candidatus Binatia bacterium]|jgi:alpha-L-fucosidase|nr:alpha-L-fucosidase [Candidatus Binatia bacterium]